MADGAALLTDAQLRSSIEDLTDSMVEILEENRLLKLRIESLERIIRDRDIDLPPLEHDDHNEVGC